jgi:hypothetical protein
MRIEMDSPQLAPIYAAGEQVTLVRPVYPFVASSVLIGISPPSIVVAWQAFPPFEHNSLDWSDDYYGFATSTPLVPGSRLQIAARTAVPLQPGRLQVLDHGTFSDSGGAVSPAFLLGNRMQGQSFSLGLMQLATIKGTAALLPLCAVPVLFGQTASLMPDDSLTVFLSSCRTGGTVIPDDPARFSVPAAPGQVGPTLGLNQQNQFFRIS